MFLKKYNKKNAMEHSKYNYDGNQTFLSEWNVGIN